MQQSKLHAIPSERPSSASELEKLLEPREASLRSALGRNVSPLLEQFPIERYLESASELPALASYRRVGEACGETMAAIRARFGAELEPLYHRLAIVHAIRGAIARPRANGYPSCIESQSLKWFGDLLDDLDRADDDFFRVDHEPFVKDLAVCLGRLVPVGGPWVIERSGLSRKSLLCRDPLDLISRSRFVIARARGFKPYLQIHMTHRFGDRFNEAERTACYLRVAELLDHYPDMKGLIGASWYLDPGLEEVSPELAYLRRLPEGNGARIFRLQRASALKWDAIAGSQHRKQLYEEGAYVPREALLVWPASDLLRWARSQS